MGGMWDIRSHFGTIGILYSIRHQKSGNITGFQKKFQKFEVSEALEDTSRASQTETELGNGRCRQGYCVSCRQAE
jgi:hypothetical protein